MYLRHVHVCYALHVQECIELEGGEIKDLPSDLSITYSTIPLGQTFCSSMVMEYSGILLVSLGTVMLLNLYPPKIKLHGSI